MKQEVKGFEFPELKESEDERIRKELLQIAKESEDTFYMVMTPSKRTQLIAWLEKQNDSNPYSGVSFKYNGHTWGMCARDNGVEVLVDGEIKERVFLDKSQGKSTLETWKDMRLEVYQQASGNRHEPNCSDDTTKMFSLNDIDEIFEKICEQKSTECFKSL